LEIIKFYSLPLVGRVREGVKDEKIFLFSPSPNPSHQGRGNLPCP